MMGKTIIFRGGLKVWVEGLKLMFMFFVVSACFSQNGPGGIGSTDGKSSLKLWLDAEKGLFADTLEITAIQNGGRPKMWKDMSGSNNNVYSVSDSNSPVLFTGLEFFNNKPAVRFFRDLDKTCRRNNMVSKSFSRTNDIMIYCVFHATTRAKGNNVTPFQFNGYHENMWYNGAGLVDAGVEQMVNDVSLAFCDTSIATGVGDSTTGIDYCVKVPASLNQTYVANMSKEAWSGLLKLEQNYFAQASLQAGKQPINQSEKYYIGSTSDVLTGKTQPFFDGYISTVLVFNKILTAAEKIILENYLSAKYATTLVVGDFYKMDEPELGDFDVEMFGIGRAFDGSAVTRSKGEGVIEISGSNLALGEFVQIGHNAKKMNTIKNNIPEGTKFRLERKWAVSTTVSASKIDLAIDLKDFPFLENQSPVLLIDTDNDGSFENEKIGEGIFPATTISSNGRILFANVVLKDKNVFTVGATESACLNDCDSFFSPNGDGVADVFFISKSGRTQIFDRSGRMIREMTTPAFWDGSTNSGELAYPGIYFLVTNNETHQTVTLVR